ncbi:Glycerophosphodiester phosphodiesterase [Alteracholeplasma palmae J233]|uniref:Glycerophosphodiester phosphodiesterase n=1 Tax=Alteracholeplasma palmae (strain ATCC 49389 / J233) TaxID=1318466 RepID=U4KKM6_ALTPJ|nr:glycerophosphodiester phosphodiesterase [Alteracholeplasma palmae]CCV64197.1 Glycerophosphodiester phosphodiesterase [Alteracholeplasma palmae J233]
MEKINIKKTLSLSLSLIKKNFFRYVFITILIEFFLILLMNEIIKNVFNIALLTAKIDGISNDNFTAVFKNPIAVLILLLVVIISVILIILQVTITYYYASTDYKTQNSSFKKPLLALKKIKLKHLLILLVYIFLIMPNGNIGMSSGLTSKVHLPEFIVEAFFENTLLTVLYYTLILISFYLNIRLFYTFVIFTNEPLSFFDSMKKSWAKTKKNSLRILVIVGIISVIPFLLIGLSYLINLGLYNWLSSLFPSFSSEIKYILQEGLTFCYIIILSVSTIFLIQISVVSYNVLNKTPVIKEDLRLPKFSHYKKLRYSVFGVSFVLLVIIASLLTSIPKFTGNPKIVSHRGESVLAIENTLDALRIASTYKPDYVEMDIQQTQDKKIVVFHDFNLKRLANIDKRVNSLTLNELENTTIRHRGISSKIPSFYDYMSLAKELNQDIMIELKTTRNDSDTFIDDMMAILDELDYRDHVVFQSLDINIILKLKEKYPNVTTGYIIGFNLGGLKNYDIDFYSMSSYSVSKKVLSDIRRYNKSLFIWDVNSESDISYYLQLDIAGIITDQTELSKEVKLKLENGNFSNILFNFEFNLFP